MMGTARKRGGGNGGGGGRGDDGGRGGGGRGVGGGGSMQSPGHGRARRAERVRGDRHRRERFDQPRCGFALVRAPLWLGRGMSFERVPPIWRHRSLAKLLRTWPGDR
eukprot:1980699-Pyramimonas_sp.AAC.1